ncbi:MAG TPA: hypothetical protein VGG86_08695 [Roseiarcus sp.]
MLVVALAVAGTRTALAQEAALIIALGTGTGISPVVFEPALLAPIPRIAVSSALPAPGWRREATRGQHVHGLFQVVVDVGKALFQAVVATRKSRAQRGRFAFGRLDGGPDALFVGLMSLDERVELASERLEPGLDGFFVLILQKVSQQDIDQVLPDLTGDDLRLVESRILQYGNDNLCLDRLMGQPKHGEFPYDGGLVRIRVGPLGQGRLELLVLFFEQLRSRLLRALFLIVCAQGL